jgi:hypothetical protein
MPHYTAIVTVLVVLFYFFVATRVGASYGGPRRVSAGPTSSYSAYSARRRGHRRAKRCRPLDGYAAFAALPTLRSLGDYTPQ